MGQLGRWRDVLFQPTSDVPPSAKIKKAQARLAVIPTSELAAWVERSLYELGKAVHDWQRDPDQRYLLDEAVDNAHTLVEVTEALRKRQPQA